ncbi:MAG: hypothetical protein NWF00_03135 [Candidatus Bathyarchaeota archaeon]|nr:hypothetical protein [Candidatus Bathyarchaeota archaeon]
MKQTIGIFSGKQKDYNIRTLTLLWDFGPQSAWELANKMSQVRGNKISLHATLNKRLRILEKKGYLRRIDKKWFFTFKGLLAVLLVLPEPRTWNVKWIELFEAKKEIMEDLSAPIFAKYGFERKDVRNMLIRIGLLMNDFEAWVDLSNRVKSLMERGIINFDLIRESTLLNVLIWEGMTAEEMANLTIHKPEEP